MTDSFKLKIHNWLLALGTRMGIDLGYFVKNGFWMSLHQLVDISIGIVFFALFARLASQETFGYYQFILAVFSLVSVVSIPGLNTSILREVSRGNDGEYIPAVRKSFLWSLIGLPLIVLLGAYYYLFISHELGLIIMTASIFFPFFYAPNTWNSFLLGKCEYKKFTLFGITQSFLNTSVTLSVVYLSHGNAFLIISAYLLTCSLGNVAFYYKSLASLSNSRNSGEAMPYGWFLTKINFFNYAADNIDKFIIGFLLSPVMLAAFSVVSTLPFRLRMLVKSVFSIAFPKMAQDSFEAKDFLKTRKGKLVALFFSLFSIAAGAGYFFLIVPVSSLIFGDQYQEYYHYGKYFTVLVIMHMPLVFVTWYLQAKKMSHSIAFVNVTSFSIKIVSLVIGIKLWGIAGAIWMYNMNTFLLLLLYIGAIYQGERSLAFLFLRKRS
jgi:O-antigen/teichoic acid export membrane protein